MIIDTNTAIFFFGGGEGLEEGGDFDWISNKQPLRKLLVQCFPNWAIIATWKRSCVGYMLINDNLINRM